MPPEDAHELKSATDLAWINSASDRELMIPRCAAHAYAATSVPCRRAECRAALQVAAEAAKEQSRQWQAENEQLRVHEALQVPLYASPRR